MPKADGVTRKLEKTKLSPTPERRNAAGAAATRAAKLLGSKKRKEEADGMEEDEDEEDLHEGETGTAAATAATVPVTLEELQGQVADLSKRLQGTTDELEYVRQTTAANTTWTGKQGVDLAKRSLMAFARGPEGLSAEAREKAVRKLAKEEGVDVIGVEVYGGAPKAPVEVIFGDSKSMRAVLKKATRVEGTRCSPKVAEIYRAVDTLVHNTGKAASTHQLMRSWTAAQPPCWTLVDAEQHERSLTVQLQGDICFCSGPLAAEFDKRYGQEEQNDSQYTLPWRCVIAKRQPKLSDNQEKVVSAAGRGKGRGKGSDGRS